MTNEEFLQQLILKQMEQTDRVLNLVEKMSNLPTQNPLRFSYDVEVGENGTFLSTDETEEGSIDPNSEYVFIGSVPESEYGTVDQEALFLAAEQELEGLDLEYGDTGTDSPD